MARITELIMILGLFVAMFLILAHTAKIQHRLNEEMYKRGIILTTAVKFEIAILQSRILDERLEVTK